jgi:nucleoside-diphosphate-sugar epimerase
MSVLVTGASGFVGVNLVRALLERGENVVSLGIDQIPAPAHASFEALPGTLIEVSGDVLDPAALRAVFAAAPIERVWHGAAITAGPERERRDARRVIEVNLLGTLAMLDASAAAGVRRFVYPSSSSVYGATALDGTGPIDEDARAQPLALYGISKTAAEALVLRAREVHGLDTLAGRINAVFGPWERDTGLRDTLSPMFQMLCQARDGREAVLAPGMERDWVYAPDVAVAFVCLLYAARPAHRVYNISQGELWHARVFGQALTHAQPAFRYRIAADPSEVTLDYAGPLDRPRRLISIDRITRDLGWRPSFSPEAACADLVRWSLIAR